MKKITSQGLRKKKVKTQIAFGIITTAISIIVFTIIALLTRTTWNFFGNPFNIFIAILISLLLGILCGAGIGKDINVIIIQRREEEEKNSENKEK